MTKLLLARDVADNSIDALKDQCLTLARRGLTPKMKVILVGDNSASRIYIKHKRILCEKVGADFDLVELNEKISKEEFLHTINEVNSDDSVTGCFVQLPIPKHLQDIDVTTLINPLKDIDGFHTDSIAHLYKNYGQGFTPCTPKGIMSLLKYHNIACAGKHVVIIGRSLIVGKPLSLLMTNENATVTLCHSRTKNIESFTKQADIIVCAIGIANYLTPKYLRDDQSQVIIDVGMNKNEHGKTCGDVDFSNVSKMVLAITPVPGGVGPMTVLSLVENLIKATENILNKRQ